MKQKRLKKDNPVDFLRFIWKKQDVHKHVPQRHKKLRKAFFLRKVFLFWNNR